MDKHSQQRLIIGIILGIIVFSIVCLTLISAPGTQNGKVIISSAANNLNNYGTVYSDRWRII